MPHPVLGTPAHRDGTVGGMVPYGDFVSADLTGGGATTGDGSEWCECSILNRSRVAGAAPSTRTSKTDPIDGATTLYTDTHQRGFTVCHPCLDVATYVNDQRAWNPSGLLSGWKAASNCVTTARTGVTEYFVRADGNDANDGLTDSAGGAKLTVGAAVALALGAVNRFVTVNGGAGAVAMGSWQSMNVRGTLVRGTNTAIVTQADDAYFRFATGGSQVCFRDISFRSASGNSFNSILTNAAGDSSAKCFWFLNCDARDGGAGNMKHWLISENGATGAICDGVAWINCNVQTWANADACYPLAYSENPCHYCFFGVTADVTLAQGHLTRMDNNASPSTSTNVSFNACSLDNDNNFTAFGTVCPFVTLYSVVVVHGAVGGGSDSQVEPTPDNRWERCKILDATDPWEYYQRPRSVCAWGCYSERTLNFIAQASAALDGAFVRACVFDCGSSACIQVPDPTSGTDAANVYVQSCIGITSGVPIEIGDATPSYAAGSWSGNVWTTAGNICDLNGVAQNLATWNANSWVGTDIVETVTVNTTTLAITSGTNVLTSGVPAVLGGGTTFIHTHFNEGATTCPSGGWSGAALAAPTIGTITPANNALSVAYTASNPIRAHSGDVEGESDTVTADAATPVSLTGTNGVLLYFTMFQVTATGAMSPESAQASGTPASSGVSVVSPRRGSRGGGWGRGHGGRGSRFD